MDPTFLKDQDRISSSGENSVEKNSMERPPSPRDERNVSANPSADAAFLGPSRHTREQPQFSDGSGGISFVPAISVYPSHDQSTSYGGYVDYTGTWEGYPQYLNTAEGLHIPPVIMGDNQSLLFHSGYILNPEMAYGQYSPVATPMPSVIVDGQLYSPQQLPFSPSFYPQSTPPSVPSPVPSDLITPESDNENLIYGPGSGYLLPFGSYGGLNMSGAPGSSPLTSPAAYPPPMGILGPYEHHVGQIPEKRSYNGFGISSASSAAGHYQSGISYQNTNFGSGSISHLGSHDRVRLAVDKGRRRERDQDSFSISNDTLGFDRNRGPRASKLKGKSATKRTSTNRKDDSSSSDIQSNSYNRPDFVTDYENAKFFVIKSFSEDNVHKSIKYNVWASTPHGNKKLDAAYHEARGLGKSCPIFLLFSVNASGQFVGVAEMIGPVDFEKDADYWQQDRWSGRFPVKWHILKDVPNSRFRNILLENNENKPVTHSRDCQEVKREQGIEMLKIFKDYEALTSILDDFEFYDQREKALKERKARHHAGPTTESASMFVKDTMDQMAGRFKQTLQLNSDLKGVSNESTSSKTENAVSRADDPKATSVTHSIPHALNSGEKGNKTLAGEWNGEHQD